MHEIGLCEGVLGVALEASAGEPVRRVRVRVGRLQAVVPILAQSFASLLPVRSRRSQALLAQAAPLPVRLP